MDEESDTEGLVKMVKGDEVIFVHPTTVEDHVAAGWSVATLFSVIQLTQPNVIDRRVHTCGGNCARGVNSRIR